METLPTKESPTNPNLAGKFKIVGTNTGKVFMGKAKKEINFKTISLKEAQRLHSDGCKYLQAIQKEEQASDKKEVATSKK